MNATPQTAPRGQQPLHLRGAAELSLTDDRIWRLVSSGALDVFLADPGAAGDGGSGRRHHLFTARPGELVCGIPTGVTAPRLLTGVGNPEAELVSLDTLSDPALLIDPAKTADDWAAKLTSAAIEQTAMAGEATPLPAGVAEYPTGSRLVPGEATVWARLVSGRASFMESGPAYAPLETDVFTPVCGRACVSVGEKAVIETATSAELRARGLLSAALAAFHRRIAAAWSAKFEAQDGRDRNRLREKSRRDSLGVSRALTRIAAAIAPGTREALLAGANDDPLLDACRLVARASHANAAGESMPAEGALAERLLAFAADSGLRVRKVTLDPGWWRRDNGPLLVVFAEDGRPGAALPRKPGRYDLYDPSRATVESLTDATAGLLNPEAYMFYAPFQNRALTGRDLLAFALQGRGPDLGAILFAGTAAALLSLVTPVMTGTVIDSAIPRADVGLLGQIGVLILVSILVQSAFEIVKAVALLRLTGTVDARVQSAVTDRLLALPASFFKNYACGDLASRCLGINQINAILSGVTVNGILAAVFSSFNLLLLFYYDWRLALAANAFVLVTMTVAGLVGAGVVAKQRALLALQGKKQGMELEYLTGIAKLRLTGAETRAFGAWSDVFAAAKTLAYQAGKAYNTLNAVNAAFPTLAAMLLFSWFFHARAGEMGLGQFMAFFTAFAAFQTAMTQLVTVMADSLEVVPLMERAMPILRAVPEAAAAKAKPKELRGEIEISHVVFRYHPEGPAILSDLCIHAAPGEFVALVGDSGAGKSTVLRLLLGFETPQSGAVYYDGQDIAELDVRALRRRIGVVLQDDKPRAGSLYENIVGSSNLGIADAWEAARMAGLDEDIEAMPMGMHTIVPPGGAGFSGGQIQRLLIARALVRRPKILFFDEATSALDNKTQAVVSGSIARLKVTRLVIAHRLSTVMGADKIYALRQGRVVESGTYEELMSKEGFFYELAKRQIA